MSPASDPPATVTRTRQAHFISAQTPAAVGDPAVYFRRDFTAEQTLVRATLRITALGIVVPYLNGTRVGDEVLAPGWTSYRHRLMVSSYDVTPLLVAGENTLGAVVGEGWAVGALTWENRRHNYTDRPVLFAQLELEYPGRVEIVGSDEKFRVGTGAVRSNGIYAGEDFDARLASTGWHRPGFDDRTWPAAQLFDWSLETLETTVAPPIRRIDELAAVEILTSPSGKRIVDFGQNISGWVRLTVTGEEGTTVTMRHAEVLTPAGELETETNRSAAATDRYTLRGGATETWEPAFTFHGFRYVQVDGWPGELTAGALTAVVVHSDMPRTGWFETSNPLVNKLHDNTVWSMRGNFVGLPTDCPQRDERLGWTGDLNAFAPTATFLYDVRGVLGSWLRDLAAEQRVSGTVPWVVPDVLPTPSSATALWSDVAVSLPWELYQEYGDLEILRQSYESMVSFMREVEGALDQNGLWSTGFQFGDWLDPDAPADNPADGKTDRYLIASAYLVKTSRQLADTAALLGNDRDAEHFGGLHQRVRRAFCREYVTEAGRVVNESATAYAVALMFDILDENQRQAAGGRLAGIVTKAAYKISTGFAGTPLITEALSSSGHLTEAYRLLLETECPSFLYPVTKGATSIWERWDAVLPDGTLNATGMTSLNHYALGAVASWLHRVVGGLVRTAPGWRHFRIAPQPGGGLTSAHAAHDTVHGRAEVQWSIDGIEMTVIATVPDRTTATVVLPLHTEDLVEEVAAGTYTWRYPIDESYGRPVPLTMDTPMGQLSDDAEVWTALQDVFHKHFPGVPLDAGGAQSGDMSLNSILERIRLAGGFPGLEADMRAALLVGTPG